MYNTFPSHVNKKNVPFDLRPMRIVLCSISEVQPAGVTQKGSSIGYKSYTRFYHTTVRDFAVFTILKVSVADRHSR
jgi:hypothetical protein